jgi:hypothetical protein
MYCTEGQLAHFPGKSALCHWHDDLEFVLSIKGHMTYCVNGKDFFINEGEGILINAKQLHYGYSADGTNCEFICILLHPKLICTNDYIESQFVKPVLKNLAFEQMFISSSEPCKRILMEYYMAIYKVNATSESGYELEIQSIFNLIWKQLYQILSSDGSKEINELDKDLMIQKKMIDFIHKKYIDKISLRDIADAGNVCRSKCCKVFKTYLHQTPTDFLNRYRLERSVVLITASSSSKPVTS